MKYLTKSFYDTFAEVTRCKPLCGNGFYWQQLQFFLSLQEKNRPISAEKDKSEKVAQNKKFRVQLLFE